jgi:tRNA-dihydrouridine synthase A
MTNTTPHPMARGKVFSIAPMMDWTDRHCRYFHRQLTKRALLYTEMVVADAVIHGSRERLLVFSPEEQPIALQLGGSDPAKMAVAAKIGEQFGYREINMNVGCPSDRVKSGTFGACLMETPDVVAQCVSAMKAAVGVPVTVKCRIGVDAQDPEHALNDLADKVFAAGADAIWVHARKAWLQGLSPKENREIPPLDYDRVYRLKQRLTDKFVGINGGISSIAAASQHLFHVDGVMLGRAAYHNPGILLGADHQLFGDAGQVNLSAVVWAMAEYAHRHIASGGKLNQVTRHMLGLFHGVPGARQWRHILSEQAGKPGAGPSLLAEAMSAIVTKKAA